MKKIYSTLLAVAVAAMPFLAEAGNDTKRGQAGASELLVNPWARSSGMAGSYMAGVNGVEAMALNVAGLSYTNNTEVALTGTRYLSGSDISITALGLAQRVGQYGVLGISFTGFNLGNFQETRFAQPDGTGNTFAPNVFNIGAAYSQQFSNKITGGLLVRGVFQSIPNASASSVAIDAGVMYRTGGEKSPFKLGVALRNVGPRMRYEGDGFTLNSRIQDPDNTVEQNTVRSITNGFELPATLSISTAYDWYVGEEHRITTAGTFQSNSYTQDQYLFGVEYGFRNLFMLRAGLNYQASVFSDAERRDLNSGPTFGATFNLPLEKVFSNDSPDDAMLSEDGSTAPTEPDKKKNRYFSIDYSFRSTNPFNGTHSIGLILNL